MKELAGLPFGGDELTATEAEELAALFQAQRFAAGSVLYREGEEPGALYVLRDGRVELVRTDERGQTRMLDVMVQGDLFGETALLSGAEGRVMARVVEDAELCFVTREAFERLTRERPYLAVKVLRSIAAKLQQPDRLDAFTYERQAMRANRVLVVAGAADGLGCTFVAANLARALADLQPAEGGRGVGFLELDAPFGNAASHFGCPQPTRDLTGFLAALEEQGDDASVSEWCAQAAPGVWLLPAPREALDEDVLVGDVVRLVRAMRAAFDRVVVDVPAGLGPVAQAAVNSADRALVVTTYTVDAVDRTNRLLASLASLPGHPDKFPLVVNRRGSTMDVERPEKATLHGAVLARIENSCKVPRALADGYLWYDRHGRSAITGAFRLLASRLTGSDDLLGDRAAFLAAWLPFREQAAASPVAAVRGGPPPLAAVAGRTYFRRRSGQARLALGEAFFLAGRHFRALQELRRAVDDDPTLSRGYLLLGEVAQSLGRRREALTYYEAALRADPDDLKALVRYATGQPGAELLESCRLRLATALKAHPDWPDLHCLLGNASAAAGDGATASREFAEALRLNPRYGEAWRGLGDLSVSQRRPSQAVECYLRALRVAPGDLLARYALAKGYQSLGLPGLAAEACEAVIELCPHHGGAQSELGRFRDELSALDDEVASLEAALQMNPDFADTHLRLGEAYTRKGLVDKALRSYKLALRFNPDLLVAKEAALRVRAIKERIERGRESDALPTDVLVS